MILTSMKLLYISCLAVADPSIMYLSMKCSIIFVRVIPNHDQHNIFRTLFQKKKKKLKKKCLDAIMLEQSKIPFEVCRDVGSCFVLHIRCVFFFFSGRENVIDDINESLIMICLLEITYVYIVRKYWIFLFFLLLLLKKKIDIFQGHGRIADEFQKC